MRCAIKDKDIVSGIGLDVVCAVRSHEEPVLPIASDRALAIVSSSSSLDLTKSSASRE